MVYDIIVVGGGPAGLFAAISGAEAGASALVLERMPSPGRKLLVSGSGRCNLTHSGTVASFLDRYGAAGKFLRPALYGFTNGDLEEFFTRRGVSLDTEEGGKVFPVSRRARDVLDALLAELRERSVKIDAGIRALSAVLDAGLFRVETERGPEYGRSLLVATGGRSYPKTGSTGDGYALAASFGHRVVDPVPALTPVVASFDGPFPFAPFVACSGVSVPDAAVSVFRDGRKAAAGRGDVLFTHRGLSGPGILDLSRSIRAGDELRVCLAPGSGDLEAVDRRLLSELDAHGKRGVLRALGSFGLPDSLARAALAACGSGGELKSSELPRRVRRELAAALAEGGDCGLRFVVAGTGGWEEAMATKGGVDLSEVDRQTMESRLAPGLFFAGEILDVDGDTGGFNLQAAFSTGRLAGISAARHAKTLG